MKSWYATAGMRLLLVALLAGVTLRAGRAPLDDARLFLTNQFQLRSGDFTELERRRAIAHTLETEDGREVATLGVVQIAVPASFYVEQLRDVVAFKKEGAAVLQIGTFSTPARVDDIVQLSLDDRDIESLRRCRPGDCKVQLSADALDRVRRDVPWGSPGAGAAANHTMREVLVDLVNRYRNAGDAGLMTYVDADRPLSVSTEFRSMIAARPAVLERFPELHRHVVDFPKPQSTDVDDVMYWSKEKMGPAVIVSVTHLAITRLAAGASGIYAAASKQLYGSHYFDSSLGITLLLDARVGNEPATFLVYVNRSRIDALTGFWGGMKRTIVRSRTRSTMSSSLIEARDLVERRFRTHSASTQ